MNLGYIDPAYGIKSQRGPLEHDSGYYISMNQANKGLCKINQKSLNVPGDSKGFSELTGMRNYFTCAELEVF